MRVSTILGLIVILGFMVVGGGTVYFASLPSDSAGNPGTTDVTDTTTPTEIGGESSGDGMQTDAVALQDQQENDETADGNGLRTPSDASTPTEDQSGGPAPPEPPVTNDVTQTSSSEPPIANDMGIAVNNEDQIEASFDASNPNSGRELEYSLLARPDHGSVALSGNSFTYVPDPNYSGTDSFTYRVTDSDGESATAAVTLNVKEGNDSPSAGDISISTQEGSVVEGSFNASDPNADDTLAYSIRSEPDYGSVSISGEEFVYTPNSEFTGTDSFTYTVSDGNGGTATARVTVTVTDSNVSPEANDVSVSTRSGSSVTAEFAASDQNGDTLTYTITSQPDHGSVTVSGEEFRYVPESEYSGSDSFTYEASDGNGGADSARVSVTVETINQKPIANPIPVSTKAGSSVTASFNASDPNDDSLSFSVESQPSHGTVSISEESFIYTPESGYAGNDSFSYRVSDGNGGSDTATVAVSVQSINKKPTANEMSVNTTEEESVTASFNAEDPDGDSLTFSIISEPSHGSVSVTGNSFTYTPTSGYSGDDSFSYEVRDGRGGSNTATVSLSVSAASPDQDPFDGTPIPLPNRIQAENFDEGGEGVAYHDTTEQNKFNTSYRDTSVDIYETVEETSGYNIGHFEDNEWLEYTVDTEPKTYDIELRVATNHADGKFKLALGGETLRTVEIPDTGGWDQWQTITVENVEVGSGEIQVLRVTHTGADVDFNWMEFEPVETDGTPEQSSLDDSPLSLPVKTEASHFNGGKEYSEYLGVNNTVGGPESST